MSWPKPGICPVLSALVSPAPFYFSISARASAYLAVGAASFPIPIWCSHLARHPTDCGGAAFLLDRRIRRQDSGRPPRRAPFRINFTISSRALTDPPEEKHKKIAVRSRITAHQPKSSASSRQIDLAYIAAGPSS